MAKTHYLTPDGLDKLKTELEELKNQKRPDVVAKIEQAKDYGDLSENAEYHAAKEELAFIDGRIQQIQEILHNAVVIEESKSPKDKVGIGSRVAAELGGRQVLYRVVGSDEADPAAGLISNESPLGRAFLGKKIGEQVEVETPGGKNIYTIMNIE